MTHSQGKTPPLIPVEESNAARFAPFGALIDPPDDGGRVSIPTSLSPDIAGGEATLSFITVFPPVYPEFNAAPERHPFSVQAFVPLGDAPLICVVAPAGPAPSQAADFRAFRARPHQAVVLREGTWHLGMMCEREAMTVAVFVHRLPDGKDTEACPLSGVLRLDLTPSS